MVHNLRVFWSATKGSFANFMAEYTLSLFLSTAVPRYILQTVFFVLLAGFAGGPELMRFALIGNVIQVAVNLGLANMAAVVESEKWLGTLPMLIAAPSNKLPALVGRGTAYMAQGVMSIAAALLGGIIIFGPLFSLSRVLLATPLIILVIFTISGMGILIGAIALPSRIGVLISNMVAYIMMIICGVNFPIAALPKWVQSISGMLPVTNGLLAIRHIIDGGSYQTILPLIMSEVIIGIIYLAVGYFVFEARLYNARKRGTIELF